MQEAESLLDRVTVPEDLRRLERECLPALAAELRRELITLVSKTGGHLGAGLGVVELTLALHYVFNTPEDRLVWDVGHQTYPHKMVTGRRHLMSTLRQGGGLSGFTKRSESPYDPFGAAHAGTSLSAGLGMALARDLEGEERRIICVIGDGALSAGMAYEAMNNAGGLQTRLLVILNDNDMSIARPVGSMSAYLARLVSGKTYHSLRRTAKRLTSVLPTRFQHKIALVEEYLRGFLTGGTLFEELGFRYIGPLDGHNFDQLLPVLENIRETQEGPLLLHVVTKKGKGYAPAEGAEDKYHGVGRFDIKTGRQLSPSGGASAALSYTQIFAQALIEEARRDPKIVAFTAAMPSGTGLDHFTTAFPKRCFDVGIAEQHAVTCAAGMATEGYKPFVAIYSTFLQRAYDQVLHDVAIQGLPVRFAIDRAGLVGADGPTHAGAFDIAYLGNLPGFVLMAASDTQTLRDMVATAAAYDAGPCAFRYPRGSGTGEILTERGTILPIGKGCVLQEGSEVALLSYGGRLQACRQATALLEKQGISVTLVDARFAKPLDTELLEQLVQNHQLLVTIEEGAVGGFGSFVLQYLSAKGLLSYRCQVRSFCLPDYFIEQDTPENMYAQAELDVQHIVARVTRVLSQS